MHSNHKNKSIFRQAKLLFEFIDEQLTQKELKCHRKFTFFD